LRNKGNGPLDWNYQRGRLIFQSTRPTPRLVPVDFGFIDVPATVADQGFALHLTPVPPAVLCDQLTSWTVYRLSIPSSSYTARCRSRTTRAAPALPTPRPWSR